MLTVTRVLSTASSNGRTIGWLQATLLHFRVCCTWVRRLCAQSAMRIAASKPPATAGLTTSAASPVPSSSRSLGAAGPTSPAAGQDNAL